MTKRALSLQSKSGGILMRILGQPNLVEAIQQLEPKKLNELIQQVGLEDSGEIVALASSEQLIQIFDEDLWKNEKPGQEETFDSERFRVWLEVLLEMGSEFAAGKIAELDEDFLTAALSHQILVLDLESLIQKYHGTDSDQDLVDKALESSLSHDFDQYVVIAKKHDGWDAVLSLLASLDTYHHDLLERILSHCCYLSSEYIDDHGGLYEVLTAEEQLHSDVAYEREKRREKEGYVTPVQAAHFLGISRDSGGISGSDPTLFKGMAKTYLKNVDSDFIHSPLTSSEILQIPQEPHQGKYPALKKALEQLRQTDSPLYFHRMTELTYLANILVSGCSFQGRRLRPVEAAEVVLATCHLSLEKELMGPDPEAGLRALRSQELVVAFQRGWSRTYADVVLRSARALLQNVSSLVSSQRDPWMKDQLSRLLRDLKASIETGKPWECLDGLDFLETLWDSAVTHAWKSLIDECPSLPTLLLDRRDGKTASRENEFISRDQEIQIIQKFLESHG